MKTMTVGEFKAKFSDVIEMVKNGEEIAVTYGKRKDVVGYFYPEIEKKRERILGIYDKMPGYFMANDFCVTTDDEFQINDLPLT